MTDLLPPKLRVEWHHLQKFYPSRPLLIWITIFNDGGEATLHTDGSISGLPLGRGRYPLLARKHLELGYIYDGPPLANEHIMPDGCVHYAVYLFAENEAGTESYIDVHKIPVYTNTSSTSTSTSTSPSLDSPR